MRESSVLPSDTGAASPASREVPPALLRTALGLLLLASLAVHLWGIRRNLPYTAEVDEPIYVTRAVRMAATGSLNPGWFGNPGSTLFYPLAAAYHVWEAASHGGRWLGPNASLSRRFDSDPVPFYLAARLLCVLFSVAAIALVSRIGARAFDPVVGLAAALVTAASPLIVSQSQLVRSDSPATFFTLAALALFLELPEGGVRKSVLAGITSGLAIATRYLMAALVPILALAHLPALRRGLRDRAARGPALRSALFGLAAIPLAFAASTPFFFLDSDAAVANLRYEARPAHPGGDGLSRPGNLVWYVRRAIPDGVGWPAALLSVAGIAGALRRRDRRQLLLLFFLAFYLALISLSHLHWHRWILQALPIVALFAASGLRELAARLPARIPQRRVVLLGAALASAGPAFELVSWQARQAAPGTRVLARAWILEHVPPGSGIAEEDGTAPLTPFGFDGHRRDGRTASIPPQCYTVLEQRTLSSRRTLEDYRRDGYTTLVVSSDRYGLYYAEPRRYREIVAFYERLFREGRLLKELVPSGSGGGPVVRIYGLEPERVASIP